MAYFKIGENDYSAIVNELTVTSEARYNAQVNAAGNTVIDYINTKRVLTIGFIPLGAEKMKELQTAISQFTMAVSFRNPATNELETINCYVPTEEIKYYTIQTDRVLYNAMTVEFIEL